MTSEVFLPTQLLPFCHMLWELLIVYTGKITWLFVVVTVAVRYIRSPWRSVPPGPKGFPILGHALQLRDKSWLFKRDCKDEFGTRLFCCVA